MPTICLIPIQFQGKPKRDIVFVVDDSGSISEQNFEKAKEGVINLLSSFCPQKLGEKLDH